MWKLILLFVTQVCCIEYRPETTKFYINIKENGTRFVQHIETDMYRDHVYYHTPKHNQVKETHTMQDFQKGLHMSCWPELKRCFLNYIEAYPNAAKVMQDMARMWSEGKDSASSDNETIIIQNWIPRETEIENEAFLGMKMREFRHRFNFPLYWREKLPHDANLLHLQGTASRTHLTKRASTARCSVRTTRDGIIPNAVPCSNGGYASHSYVYTDGACDHVYFCRDNNCGNNHIYGRHYFVALCCPDAQVIGDCYACMPI